MSREELAQREIAAMKAWAERLGGRPMTPALTDDRQRARRAIADQLVRLGEPALASSVRDGDQGSALVEAAIRALVEHFRSLSER